MLFTHKTSNSGNSFRSSYCFHGLCDAWNCGIFQVVVGKNGGKGSRKKSTAHVLHVAREETHSIACVEWKLKLNVTTTEVYSCLEGPELGMDRAHILIRKQMNKEMIKVLVDEVISYPEDTPRSRSNGLGKTKITDEEAVLMDLRALARADI
ncbi:hypothetical protein BCR41DRAFT_368604 [Lobosporangium transversale]|uniref:Uncharacterized protein n=1 Tax=Lobosporangium transversale TaxID=64571 RepID=A0A1Y2GUP8_9FUNG|nr:hypothetical protein BCR41DRAFT_368604 [Lobosporangium transversale]ORZ24771.1 hypothetical protein BCR41DRAFT_368604 [Lobosporangium transversale]|eukprot:XP_021883752.1 hypothetical protein BCR41DRAFT_368604 [Lobosporangium transversale]